MINQPTPVQVKVTFPEQLYFFLKSRADRFGLPVSAYIKNLVIDDVKAMDFPTFKMSERTEKVGLAALNDLKNGDVREIEDVDRYLDNL